MLYFNAPSEITLAQVSPIVYQYFFESADLYILEIKRIDAFGSSVSNKQWVSIQKSNLKVATLNLQFIDSSTFVEERFFEEGYLKFNGVSGTYIEKYNSAQHSLTQINTLAIPNLIHQAVADFI